MSKDFIVLIITGNTYQNARVRIATGYMKSLNFNYYFQVSDQDDCYTAIKLPLQILLLLMLNDLYIVHR